MIRYVLNLLFKAPYEKLNKNAFDQRWFFSTNHKYIGTLYLIFGGCAGVLNTVLLPIRLKLSFLGTSVVDRDYQYSVAYYGLHFLTMMFFGLPVLVGGFGKWAAPFLVINARVKRSNEIQ
jgi:cytochrome c oxidase subunit 1